MNAVSAATSHPAARLLADLIERRERDLLAGLRHRRDAQPDLLLQLRRLRQAARELQAGSWRSCAGCGGPITLARIAIEPATELCTGCALDPASNWAARAAAARLADADHALG